MAKLPAVSELIKLRKSGLTFEEIGDRFGVSRQAVHQKINYHKIARKPKPHKTTRAIRRKPKKGRVARCRGCSRHCRQ